MKVLHISGATSWGGNEQQLMDIIPALEKVNVHNLVFGVKDSPLHKKCVENSISFVFTEKKKLNKFSNYKLLKTIVNRENPDVIHLHTSNAVTVFVLSDLLFKLNTPTVFSKKGMGNSMSILSKYKYNYKNINATFCVSQAVMRSMKEKVTKAKNYNKLIVLYEGINIKRIQSAENTQELNLVKNKAKYIVGNIANHVPAKDLNTLILAINYIVKELNFHDFHLFQIGDYTKHTDSIKLLIEELGIQDYVTLAGFVKDATTILPSFDVYAMSSEREGLPLTIYEAFYKKTPVVSTKAGGIPEVIKDGYNGYLVDVKNYKLLGKRIVEVLESKEIQNNFKERSYKLLLENYDVNKTAVKMLDAYNDVIL